MAAQDFIINEDIEIANGDFVIGDSAQQHVAHIIAASPGSYPSEPLLGVGLPNELGSEADKEELKAEIKRHVESDNYETEVITIDNIDGELAIGMSFIRTID